MSQSASARAAAARRINDIGGQLDGKKINVTVLIALAQANATLAVAEALVEVAVAIREARQ